MRVEGSTDGPLTLVVSTIVAALNPAAVLLYGSRATGREDRHSDYDIAVLMAGAVPDWQDMKRLQSDLEAALDAPADVVVLDDASPILAMQVLREGRLLDCANAQTFENFTVRSLTDYADLKITRREAEKRLLESLPMTSDVLPAKLASIERCLTRIRSVTNGDPKSVRELDIQEIVLLNLQRAIQAAIDLAAHLIASRSWGLPESLKQHFTILEQHGIVGADLADRLRRMSGFRNIAIHDYQSLDPAILEAIVTTHLPDLEEFADAIKIAAAPGR